MPEPGVAAERVALFLALVDAATRDPSEVHRLVGSPADPVAVARLLTPLAPASQLSIGNVAINGSRLDLHARSDDGREWHVDIRVPPEQPKVVTAVHVAGRPLPFAGIPGGFVVVVNGASSSGKTTLMTSLCERAMTPWIRFDDAMVGHVGLRFLIWPDTAGPINDGFVAGLVAIARAGNQVITTGALGLRLTAAVDQIPHLYVGLDCPLAVLVERQAQRDDRWGGLAESTNQAHKGWTYGLRIDTSRQTAAESADLVLEHVSNIQADFHSRTRN